ncbi:MAG: hypothetical protein WA154_11160 [Moraxellaceae bacterium]
MKQRTRRLLAYARARMAEASTWRALVLVLTAAGLKLEPAQHEVIVMVGLALAGLIGTLFPDRKKPEGA